MEKEQLGRNDKSRERVAWIDLLKITACFLVVLIHSAGQFNKTDAGFYYVLLGRPAVPLFVIATGVLLLPIIPKYEKLQTFWMYGLKRLAIPLIFWSIFLCLLIYLVGGFIQGIPSETLFSVDFFKMQHMHRRLVLWIINCNDFTGLYWYLYMLLGLYIIMPVINKWIINATRTEIKYLLGIWIFTLLMPYIEFFAQSHGYESLFGVLGCNNFGTFYYVSGFIGYLILAYYYKTYPVNVKKRGRKIFFILMYLIGLILGIVTYRWSILTMSDSEYPLVVNAIFEYCGIFCFLMTLPIFIWFRNLKIKVSPIIKNISVLTMGVYLVHLPIVILCAHFLNLSQVSDWVLIPICTIISFVISLIIVWLMKQWKVTWILVR